MLDLLRHSDPNSEPQKCSTIQQKDGWRFALGAARSLEFIRNDVFKIIENKYGGDVDRRSYFGYSPRVLAVIKTD